MPETPQDMPEHGPHQNVPQEETSEDVSKRPTVLQRQTGQGVRNVLSFEQEKMGWVIKPTLLDGALEAENILHWQTDFGMAALATHQGGRAQNADRAGISARTDVLRLVVADGMGSSAQGARAAEIATEAFLVQSGNLIEAKKSAEERMANEHAGGTCIMTAEIRKGAEGYDIHFYQAGDVRAHVIRKEGESILTVDQNVGTRDGTSDYDTVYNYLPKEDDELAVTHVQAQSGDLLLVYSDGLSGNFASEELEALIYEYIAIAETQETPWDSQEICTFLHRTVLHRMRDSKDPVFASLRREKAKQDNIGLAVLRLA